MSAEIILKKKDMEDLKGGTTLGGALLVAGTTIGGGMLALPVLTSLGGFFPAIFIYFLTWIFMACTGLLLMEVYLWVGKEANIVSMASYTLGRSGKIISWILYLFLFYSLTLAYISGGGHLVADLLNHFSFPLSSWLGSLIFIGVFSPFVYIGAKAVDRINFILMLGLMISFLAFVFLGFNFVQNNHLHHMNWPLAILATPVVFTSFAFQGMVPTLSNYMQRNPWKIRNVIWWGTAIPFITYVIWQWLILGIVPMEGAFGMRATIDAGQTAIWPLQQIIDHNWIYAVGQFFAFFAIVTSFLGVTLGLLDFLADGLKIKKNRSGRLCLSLLVFVPPLALAATSPRLFLVALDLAGGFGCALLLGVLPIFMVWLGRYRMHLKSKYSLAGGRITLLLLLLFALLEIAVMSYKIT